eukprot:436689_1
MVDGMINDGLWDPYSDSHMGVSGELCSKDHGISREDQDAFAVETYKRAQNAAKNGDFQTEITPVTIKDRKGNITIVDMDEEINKIDFGRIPKLRPVFQPNGGTITAANASSISDGASAVVLMSARRAEELGLRALARVRGFADAAQAPEKFTTAPSLAIPRALECAGLSLSTLGARDFLEINEAFSVVALANMKLLGLRPENVNVFGGAVSLGHPLGSSGSRIIVTLLNVLQRRNGRYGVAGVCNGGGGASAMVIELCES